MWGSWLDQIQKKFDDVSEFAEKAINGGYDDDEEDEEGGDVMLKNEGKGGQTNADVSCRKGSDSDVVDRQQKELKDHETVSLISHHSVTERHVERGKKGASALVIPTLSDDKKMVHDGSGVSIKEELDSVVPPVNDALEEHSPLEESSLRCMGITQTSALAMPNLAAEETTPDPVIPTLIDHAGQRDTAPRSNDALPCSAKGAEDEGQLLRFQQLLAEEMETSRLVGEKNKRLVESVKALEGELSELRLFKKNAAAVDPQKLEALEREGMELSTKLGKEHERCRLLFEKKTQLENRVTLLEEEIAQCAVKEKVWEQRMAESQTECEAARRQAKELATHLEDREREVRQLKQEMANIKSNHADLAAQHQKELSRYKTELSFQEKNASSATDTLRLEKEVLVSTLQRSQMEYERRLQELEEKLFQANRRADEAETRLTEHEHFALEPLRELRDAMDGMERQKKQLMEEVEYLRQKCSALGQSRESDNDHFMQRLAGLQSELQVVQNEKFETEQELHHWREKHSKAKELLEVTLERASRTEAAKEQLEVALEEARRRVDTNNNTSLSSSQRGTEIARIPLPSFDLSTSHMPRPLFHPEHSEVDSDVSRCGRSRMERELVRQAVEIERLHRVEEEAAETTQKLSALAAQHDILMQMYGQLQEEFQQLQQERCLK